MLLDSPDSFESTRILCINHNRFTKRGQNEAKFYDFGFAFWAKLRAR